nr:cytochrome c maturation protein CcmFc, mitochondrial [Tanacetum cinerariifolium]
SHITDKPDHEEGVSRRAKKGMTSALIWQVSSRSSKSGNAKSLPALESSSSSESLATFRAEIAVERMKLRFMLAYEVSRVVITTTFLPKIILRILERKGLLQDRLFNLMLVLERKGLLQDRLFNLMLGEQNLSRIMELSPYMNIRREAYDFLEAPVLLKWFVSRDVPTGNSNAPRTEQKAESWSAKRERARRRKVQRLQTNGNEQGQNDKIRCPGHPHLERRVEVFGPVALPVPPSSGGACVGGAPAEIGLEALTLPTSRQLMAVGHDYYKKAPMKMNISHGGVCIFMLGVLLSCDPAAYV